MSSPPAALRAAPVLLALIAFWAAGCSPATGTVSGVVTMGDKPFGNVTVSFVAPDGVIRSGIANSEGAYSVEGVPTGPMKVTVIAQVENDENAQQSFKKMKTGGAPPPKTVGKVQVNSKYSDIQTSGLSLDVKAGANKFDIPLTP